MATLARSSGSDGELALHTAFEDGTFVIALYGEMDLANADDVEHSRAEASDTTQIVLDLSGLRFIDVTGIQLLIAADARSRSDGFRLTLLRGSAPVQRLLEICGVANHILHQLTSIRQ